MALARILGGMAQGFDRAAPHVWDAISDERRARIEWEGKKKWANLQHKLSEQAADSAAERQAERDARLNRYGMDELAAKGEQTAQRDATLHRYGMEELGAKLEHGAAESEKDRAHKDKLAKIELEAKEKAQALHRKHERFLAYVRKKGERLESERRFDQARQMEASKLVSEVVSAYGIPARASGEKGGAAYSPMDFGTWMKSIRGGDKPGPLGEEVPMEDYERRYRDYLEVEKRSARIVSDLDAFAESHPAQVPSLLGLEERIRAIYASFGLDVPSAWEVRFKGMGGAAARSSPGPNPMSARPSSGDLEDFLGLRRPQ